LIPKGRADIHVNVHRNLADVTRALNSSASHGFHPRLDQQGTEKATCGYVLYAAEKVRNQKLNYQISC